MIPAEIHSFQNHILRDVILKHDIHQPCDGLNFFLFVLKTVNAPSDFRKNLWTTLGKTKDSST